MSDFRFVKNQKGFTLTEIMVVVVIIGILVAIAVPVYRESTTQVNRRAVETNLRTIESAIMRYGSTNEGAIPDKEDLVTSFQTWPVGPDGVEYEIVGARATIKTLPAGSNWTGNAAKGDYLPITW
jgi:prepilin-type N-terminal cleavage/methylation domain-containing protein